MKMKKTTIIFLAISLLMSAVVQAQSLSDGINDLHAGRVTNAVNTFKQILQRNPNDIEATYWLGQAILETEEIAGTRIKQVKDLYEKALQNSANAPLLVIGMGQIDLLENRPSEARQKFESALKEAETRKGFPPELLTAVGRANVESKNGDYNYAIQKLDNATDKGKDPYIYILLGDAYRLAGRGEGGGDAYQSYNKILKDEPNYAPAYMSLAKIFESQKNWSYVLKYLLDAVSKDPSYTKGYYELFYYYFYRKNYDEAEKYLVKYIDSKKPVTEVADEYLYAQLCWARKDFKCAIQKAESVVNALGTDTKPKIYRLLADAGYQDSNYELAKKYSDLFFERKNPDDVLLTDYENRADILEKLPNSTDENVYDTYIQGMNVDTTVDAKLGFLRKGQMYFAKKKERDYQIMIDQKLIDLRPEPLVNDYFDITVAYYFKPDYFKCLDAAEVLRTKFPEEIYGYEWAYNAANAIQGDTTNKISQDSIGFPQYFRLYEYAQKDTVEYKKQYLNSVKSLAAYYINEKKDRDKSLEFFRKWLAADPSNAESIQGYINQIEKMPANKPATESKPNGSK
ncbi:MAG: hypothetical protein R2796_12340 [Chitinophagaceae bacterium]